MQKDREESKEQLKYVLENLLDFEKLNVTQRETAIKMLKTDIMKSIVHFSERV